jgi:indole-3-glycerol phosphate synthase
MILEEIVAQKRREVAAALASLPLARLQEKLANHKSERDFYGAVSRPGKLHLIAELKRQSPSKGMLRERFDPVSLAQEAESAGASALSVLTDEPFFSGRLQYLRDARQFTELPVMRKDFIIDAYQVYEAADFGADAVLLIVRILKESALAQCLQTARQLGMEALVEVHAESELNTALDCGARIIGINHRDLDTLQMDMGLSARLVPKLPKGVVAVAESGIQTASDVASMRKLGVQAVLIGEALMTAPSISEKVSELFGLVW